MTVKIITKNFDCSSSIEDFVNEKFLKITRKVDGVIHINLSLEHEGEKAEAVLSVRGHFIKMDAITNDLYASIDMLADKVNYQVNKTIDKLNAHKKESIRYFQNPERKVDEESEHEKPIVKRKRFDMKPMMEEEALLQMEMLGHSFFFFFNGETESMCLLYKRKDGAYGLIESVN